MGKQPQPPMTAPWSEVQRDPVPAEWEESGWDDYPDQLDDEQISQEPQASSADTDVAAALAALEQAHALLAAKSSGTNLHPAAAPWQGSGGPHDRQVESQPPRPNTSPVRPQRAGISSRLTHARQAITSYRASHPIGRTTAVYGALAAVVGAAGIGAVLALTSGGSATAPATAHPVAAAAPAAPWCPTGQGPVTLGTAGGSSAAAVARTAETGDPGIDALAAFYYGYYQQRSGAAARSVVAPNAAVPDAGAIDAGIAKQIPAGTTYCAKVNPTAPGSYDVALAWQLPGGAIHTDQETVAVTTTGTPQITAITERHTAGH